MDIMLIGFWAIVGLSAVSYTPNPDPPDPRPDGPLPPRPWPWPYCPICGFFGALGGIVGGWGYTRMFSSGDLNVKSGLYAATTAVGAFVGARVLTGAYGLISGRKR